MNLLPRLRLCLVVSLTPLLVLVQAPAHADIYMQIAEIPGDATARGHEDWIELNSVSDSIVLPVSDAAAGSTRTRSVPQLSDVNASKLLDRTSPKLREALARGTIYPTVTIDITSVCEGEEVVLFQYELENVLVTSISFNASSGGDVPVEDLSLNYTKVQWTYHRYGPGCSKTGDVKAGYDKETGKV
jgi:type VI secretion system secreted protein Hcp